jgi:D-lactate dehydrogenase
LPDEHCVRAALNRGAMQLMKIAFLESESADTAFFEDKFPGDEVSFPGSIDEVPEDTEILSTFIGSRIDEAFLKAHPSLLFIATRSATNDHIDMESCARHGVGTCHVASYGHHIVAEHVFALLLALTRRLREAMRPNERAFYYEALRGTELHGKTFGLLGAGRIGRYAGALARAFGMEVIAYDTGPEAGRDATITYVELDELLGRSDVLSLHVPLNSETFEILNAATLAKCKRGVYIINTARGELVDTAALLAALEQGAVEGAGLDVVEVEEVLRHGAPGIMRNQILAHVHGDLPAGEAGRTGQIGKLMVIGKLMELPNVVYSPHIAFNCVESIDRIHEATVASIRAFILKRQKRAAKRSELPLQLRDAPRPCLLAK